MKILTLIVAIWILFIWAVTLLFLSVFMVGSDTLRNERKRKLDKLRETNEVGSDMLRNGGKKEKHRRRKRFYPTNKE